MVPTGPRAARPEDRFRTRPQVRNCASWFALMRARNDGTVDANKKEARFRGPLSLRYISSAVMVMPVMIVPAAAAEVNRLQLEAGDTGGDVQPGLPLHADRLQRVGIGRTAHQEITTPADADRRVGADAAIIAGGIA